MAGLSTVNKLPLIFGDLRREAVGGGGETGLDNAKSALTAVSCTYLQGSLDPSASLIQIAEDEENYERSSQKESPLMFPARAEVASAGGEALLPSLSPR